MKVLGWKHKNREDHYGEWYLLELGFNRYGQIWIRIPFCSRDYMISGRNMELPDQSEYINALYPNHQDGCPKKGQCGWVIDFSTFGWNSEPLDENFELRRGIKNPQPIIINSFEEAKTITNDRIIKHIDWFSKRLLGAKNPK